MNSLNTLTVAGKPVQFVLVLATRNVVRWCCVALLQYLLLL